MARRTTPLTMLIGAVLMLAACGGTSTAGASAAPTDAGGGGTETTAPASAAPASTAPEPPASQDAGGGGSTADIDVCSLLSNADVSAVSMAPIDGSSGEKFTAASGTGTCQYLAAGAPVAITSLIGGPTTDGSVPFGIYKGQGSEAIPVNGAEAIWATNLMQVFVLKNGYLASIMVAGAKDGDVKGASSSLAQTMADRMP